MKKNRIIQKGKICVVDPFNKLNQDTISVIEVEIIDIVKYKLFGKSIWKVLDLESGLYFNINEKYLYPSGMSIVRNPLDIPQFNGMDIELIESLIEYMKYKDIDEKRIKRTEALLEKIKLCLKFKEV